MPTKQEILDAIHDEECELADLQWMTDEEWEKIQPAWKSSKRTRADDIRTCQIYLKDLKKELEQCDEFASFRIGYLIDHVDNWDRFCSDVGLNPWCLNEGLADSNDQMEVSIKLLKKHGIIKD